MKDEQILAGVPDSGKWPAYNQVDDDGKYGHRLPVIRSLADIERTVGLEKHIVELQKAVDMYTADFDSLLDVAAQCSTTKKAKAILADFISNTESQHNAEQWRINQRVKGVARFAELFLPADSLFRSLALNYCLVLTAQTNQLREGVSHE